MKWISCIFAIAVSVVATQSVAFEPDLNRIEDMTLFQRYPRGTIRSQATARHVLRSVQTAQGQSRDYADYCIRRCAENLLPFRCADRVREAQARQKRRLQLLEDEAQRFIAADEHQTQTASVALPQKLPSHEPAARGSTQGRRVPAQRLTAEHPIKK